MLFRSGAPRSPWHTGDTYSPTAVGDPETIPGYVLLVLLTWNLSGLLSGDLSEVLFLDLLTWRAPSVARPEGLFGLLF